MSLPPVRAVKVPNPSRLPSRSRRNLGSALSMLTELCWDARCNSTVSSTPFEQTEGVPFASGGPYWSPPDPFPLAGGFRGPPKPRSVKAGESGPLGATYAGRREPSLSGRVRSQTCDPTPELQFIEWTGVGPDQVPPDWQIEAIHRPLADVK